MNDLIISLVDKILKEKGFKREDDCWRMIINDFWLEIDDYGHVSIINESRYIIVNADSFEDLNNIISWVEEVYILINKTNKK